MKLPTLALLPILTLGVLAAANADSTDPTRDAVAMGWRWSTPPSLAEPDAPLSPPAVIELATGTLVAVLSPSGSQFWSSGTLHLLDAASGQPIGTIRDVDGRPFAPWGTVFAADADGDGQPDICAPEATGTVSCVDSFGVYTGTADPPLRPASWPVSADLDGDGQAEKLSLQGNWPMQGWLGFVVK